jgi:hypothetical protein
MGKVRVANLFLFNLAHIAGLVAAMTENEPDVVGERTYTASLVNRDSSTRWASCLAVQFDVGELRFLVSRS